MSTLRDQARRQWGEGGLLNWVLTTAQMYGWKRAHFRPAKTAKGWRTPVQGDGAGFPDLVFVRGTRLIVAELKAGRTPSENKPRADQQAWLDAFAGVPGIEVYVWTTRTPEAEIDGALA